MPALSTMTTGTLAKWLGEGDQVNSGDVIAVQTDKATMEEVVDDGLMAKILLTLVPRILLWR